MILEILDKFRPHSHNRRVRKNMNLLLLLFLLLQFVGQKIIYVDGGCTKQTQSPRVIIVSVLHGLVKIEPHIGGEHCLQRQGKETGLAPSIVQIIR